VPPINWTFQHNDPGKGVQYQSAFECANFLKIGNDGKFTPFLAKPDKPWLCWDGKKLETWQTPVNVNFTGPPFTITETNGQAQTAPISTP
jgi:hypothetical protein